MKITEVILENKSNLNYIGNCTDDDVVEHLFGDATGFAQAVEEYGDDFVLDDLVVKYDPETDVHSFYYKNSEVIDEAKMSPAVKKHMVKQGYKFLGHGQDQDAYLAPDGTILKIFGYEKDSRGFSFSQKSFIDFANFCKKNPNNPFLPQFGGWEPFVLGGEQYIQIKCERLFDLGKSKLGLVAEQLENLVDDIDRWGAVKGLNNFLLTNVDDEYTDAGYRNATGKLITLMGGEDQLKVFAQTVEQLAKLARQKRYRLDLHSGNFMLGSDGEIVINDPFFTGVWR